MILLSMRYQEKYWVATPYVERKDTQHQIQAIFFLDVEGALKNPSLNIPEKTRKLARQAYDDLFLPEHEGYIGVEFISYPGGPMMLAVMKPHTDGSVMIAVGFNKEHPRLSTWLNQTLPEDTLMSGIHALADTASVLNEVVKRKTTTVLHRSDWPPAK